MARVCWKGSDQNSTNRTFEYSTIEKEILNSTWLDLVNFNGWWLCRWTSKSHELKMINLEICHPELNVKYRGITQTNVLRNLNLSLAWVSLWIWYGLGSSRKKSHYLQNHNLWRVLKSCSHLTKFSPKFQLKLFCRRIEFRTIFYFLIQNNFGRYVWT